MTEFTIRLSNRPGMLAALATVIARAGVNIEAMAAFGLDDDGFVRIVTDGADVTRTALDDAGVAYDERTVITSSVQNKPGSLADLTNSLAQSRVNIEAMYLIRTTNDELTFALAVDQPSVAKEMLTGD